MESPGEVPDTVAENCKAPDAAVVAARGVTTTATVDAVTVTAALATSAGLDESVAMTWNVPGAEGARYSPELVISPPPGSSTDQRTATGAPSRVARKVTDRRTGTDLPAGAMSNSERRRPPSHRQPQRSQSNRAR